MSDPTDPQAMGLVPSRLELDGKVEFTRQGLVFRGALTMGEFRQIGNTLRAIGAALQWWVGDWLLYGEHTYPEERYLDAVESTGYSYQTLTNQAWVASRFPHSRRRELLSWSHHAEVAGCEVQQQDQLLNWAEEPLYQGQEKPHSVKALRAARKNPTPTAPVILCPTCGGSGRIQAGKGSQ